MNIKISADYMESLKKLKPVIYYKGKKIDDVTSHPATAPQAQRVMIFREGDLAKKIKLAKRLAGISSRSNSSK